MKKLARFKKFSAFNALIWTGSATIIAVAIALGIIAFGPVDVLKNWNMSVGGEGKTFAVSQTVYFQSESEKLMSVPGHSDRYLVCDAKPGYIEREVAIGTIAANRPAGVNPARKNAISIPSFAAFNDETGKSTLPRVCRLHINTCYTVYGFREHCEEAETEKFTIVDKLAEGQDDDNSSDVAETEIFNFDNTPQQNIQQQSASQSATAQQPTQNTVTENTTTNNTTNEVKQPACVVDTNLLGILPVKLICQ